MMKDFPTVCPPSRIPSPYSHMSIHERNSGLREVRITKGTIAKKMHLLPGHFSICKTQPPTPTSTDQVKTVAGSKRVSHAPKVTLMSDR